MKTVYNTQPLTPEQKETAIKYLQTSVYSYIDAICLVKHAHWNVRGPVFMQLHKLFDKIYKELSASVDTIAERIQQLGGYTNGLVSSVVTGTALSDFSVGWTEEFERDEYPLVISVALVLSELSKLCYDAEAANLDFVTQNIYINAGTTLDQYLWFIEAHIPEGHPGSIGSVADDQIDDQIDDKKEIGESNEQIKNSEPSRLSSATGAS
jgi:starvation-inducible DNA-binding protein